MTKTDELESKLLKLFSRKSAGKAEEEYLIEETGCGSIKVEETEKGGEGEVTFTNGRFTRFSTDVLLCNNFFAFFNEKSKKVLRMNCDGIFLARFEDKYMLCLVELKTNINKKFGDAIKQIESNYLRTALLLSLITDVKDIEPIVFIAGGLKKIKSDPGLDFPEKVEEFRGRGNSLEAKLKEFSREGKVKINFPFFLDDTIHQNYHKKNIKVNHLDFDADFDMQSLISVREN